MNFCPNTIPGCHFLSIFEAGFRRQNQEIQLFIFSLQIQALESLVSSERGAMENAFQNQKTGQLRSNDRNWQLKLEAVNRYL